MFIKISFYLPQKWSKNSKVCFNIWLKEASQRLCLYINVIHVFDSEASITWVVELNCWPSKQAKQMCIVFVFYLNFVTFWKYLYFYDFFKTFVTLVYWPLLFSHFWWILIQSHGKNWDRSTSFRPNWIQV